MSEIKRSSVRSTARSASQQTEIRLSVEDLQRVRLIIPPTWKNLPMKVCVILGPEGTQVGLVSKGHAIEHSLESVQMLKAIPAIIDAIKPGRKEKRAETLVSNEFPNLEPKLIPKVGQRLAQLELMSKRLSAVREAVVAKPKTGYMHDEAKAVILRLADAIRDALYEFRAQAKEKTFAEVLDSKNLPHDFVNRILSPSLNIGNIDLIRLFFPADGKKHLSFSLKEIAAATHMLFAEVLKASEALIGCTFTNWFRQLTNEIKLDQDKVLNFRLYMVSPLPTKDCFRARVSKPTLSTDIAFRQLSAFNMAFVYPQYVTTGMIGFDSRDLLEMYTGISQDKLPNELKAIEDLLPDGKVLHNDEKVFAESIKSFGFVNFHFNKHEIAPDKGPQYPDHKDLVFTIDPNKVVRKAPRKPIGFQRGNARLTEEAQDLIKDLMSKKIPSDVINSVRNYFSQIGLKEVQSHAANVLYARLMSESVEIEVNLDDQLEAYGHSSWADESAGDEE